MELNFKFTPEVLFSSSCLNEKHFQRPTFFKIFVYNCANIHAFLEILMEYFNNLPLFKRLYIFLFYVGILCSNTMGSFKDLLKKNYCPLWTSMSLDFLTPFIHLLCFKEIFVYFNVCLLKWFFLKENGQVAERQANEHFERLFETLQERKSEMLRSIEQSRNRRIDQLKGQVPHGDAYFYVLITLNYPYSF